MESQGERIGRRGGRPWRISRTWSLQSSSWVPISCVLHQVSLADEEHERGRTRRLDICSTSSPIGRFNFDHRSQPSCWRQLAKSVGSSRELLTHATDTCSYHQLVLHDPIWYDHLPYIPFPSHWPIFTPKDKLAEWFEAYVKLLELNVWTQTNLESASWDGSKRQWTVKLERKVRIFRLNFPVWSHAISRN